MWNVGTLLGSGCGDVAGQPTARKAQLPSGGRMTWEANAGGRKATGNRDSVAGPPPVVSENWPDTGLVPGPERVLTQVR